MRRNIRKSDIVKKCLFGIFVLGIFLPTITPIEGIYTVILNRINMRYLATAFKIFYLSFNALFCLTIWRLYLHPLSKYPGPALAAITDWYNVYHCLTGNRHILFYKLHEKYGPIVRFGPNRLSFNSVEAMKTIYAVQSNTQKSDLYTAYSHFFKVPSTVTTIDKNAHAFKRRINVRALTPVAIKELEGSIYKNCSIFLEMLVDDSRGESGGWSAGRNMTNLVAYLMSDIMGDVAFSRNWDLLRSERNRHMIDILHLGTGLINTSGHMPALLKLGLDKIFLRKLMKGTYEFEALSKAQSDWRVSQQGKTEQKDLFAALLKARDPETGKGLTSEQLVAEAGILIVAGTDTTATALTATIFYALHYPETFARLQSEVRGTFDDAENICIGPTLNTCKYLVACIDEAMRLSPSVGAILQRETLKGGLVIENEMLPAGIDVGVSAYSMHHNDMYFPDPFVFKPERWLEDDSKTEKSTASTPWSAFTAFGVGRTSCVGKYLAYQEMAIVLARMIWLYDMRLEPGTNVGEGKDALGEGRDRKKEFQTYEKFVSDHDGPMVQFKYRC